MNICNFFFRKNAAVVERINQKTTVLVIKNGAYPGRKFENRIYYWKNWASKKRRRRKSWYVVFWQNVNIFHGEQQGITRFSTKKKNRERLIYLFSEAIIFQLQDLIIIPTTKYVQKFHGEKQKRWTKILCTILWSHCSHTHPQWG